MLRVLVRSNRDILRVRSEPADEEVRVEVDVCGVVKNTHVVHDVRGILTHGFDTGEGCKGRPDTEDTKCCTDGNC